MKVESGSFSLKPNTEPVAMDLDPEEGPNFGRQLLY